MTPPLLLLSGLGERHGPAALALALALAVEPGGAWEMTDPVLAARLGVSVRNLQSVRVALVADGVLTYKKGVRGRPARYESLCRFAEVAGTPEALPAVPVTPPKKRERKPQATDELFEVICRLAGDAVRHSAGGRVAKLAGQMLKAGLTAERLESELCVVVATYASYRTALDLDTITKCWPWILTPPATAKKAGKGGGSFDLAGRAFGSAGGNPLD